MSTLIQIAQLLKNTGGRFIVVDQGEPIGVLLSVKDYERLVSNNSLQGKEERDREAHQSKTEKKEVVKEERVPTPASRDGLSSEEEVYFEEVNPFEEKKVREEEVISF